MSAEQRDLRKRFDTTKLSNKEVKELGLEGARMAPGQNTEGGTFGFQQSGGKRSVQQGMGFTRVLAVSALAGAVGLLWYDRKLKKKNEKSVSRDEAKAGRHPGANIKD